MLEKLEQILNDLSVLHSKLLLIVGPPRSGKTILLRTISELRKTVPLNVSRSLGSLLAGMPPTQRQLTAGNLLRQLAEEHSHEETLILDNPELLFDRSLQLDPLALLKQISRSRRVIAAWPGEVQNGRLTYAEIGHPEYQDYGIDGLTIFPIQQTSKGRA